MDSIGIRWHSIPLIAVVLVGGGAFIVFALDERTLLTDALAVAFILIGGVFGGFYAGFHARGPARKRPRRP